MFGGVVGDTRANDVALPDVLYSWGTSPKGTKNFQEDGGAGFWQGDCIDCKENIALAAALNIF